MEYASQERRILFGDVAYRRDYHLERWKAYPQPRKTLVIAAINGGDFSSLAGTWAQWQELKSSSKQTEKLWSRQPSARHDLMQRAQRSPC